MRDLVLFEIWGDTRIGLIKSLEINYLKTCQSVAPTPQHRVPHFCSPLWNPFRGCWKSAAAAAYDLILVEVDGKWQWQVPVRSWHLEWGSLTEMCGLGKEKMRGLGWVFDSCMASWSPTVWNCTCVTGRGTPSRAQACLMFWNELSEKAQITDKQKTVWGSGGAG